MSFEVTHPETTAAQVRARQRRRSQNVADLRKAKAYPAILSDAEIARSQTWHPEPALPLRCNKCAATGERWLFGYLHKWGDGTPFLTIFTHRKVADGQRIWTKEQVPLDEVGRPTSAAVTFACQRCSRVVKRRPSVIERAWQGSGGAWPPKTTDEFPL